MKAVWCCPSRGRPKNLARLIRLWNQTEASSLVDLRLDIDDPSLSKYMSVWDVVPERDRTGWNIVIDDRIGPSGAMNETFHRYPKAPAYGFIGDDAIPKTRHWDQKLTDAAGDWKIAYPDDEWKQRCSQPVVGGDLVRAVGWFGFPHVRHLCIDEAWQRIGERLDCLVFCPEIVVEHEHPGTGKIGRDRTYTERRVAGDVSRFEEWIVSDEYEDLLQKVWNAR